MRTDHNVAVANSNLLPESVGLYSNLHWWHTGAGQPLRLIILSDVHIGAALHWTKIGLVAHTQPSCVWCSQGLGIQFRAYIWCKSTTTPQCGVLELRQPQLPWLRDSVNGSGPLRGTIIELTREKGRQKGKVIIKTTGRITDMNTLDQPIDLLAALTPRWRTKQNP